MMEFFAALIFVWLTFQYAYGTLPSLRWIPLVVPVIGISPAVWLCRGRADRSVPEYYGAW